MPAARAPGSEPMDSTPHDPPSHDITLDGPYEDVPAPPERPPRTRHSRKQPDGHIPRPPNAFILFRSSFIRSQRVSPDVETSHSTLSKIIGLTWQNLPADERRVWHAKARQAVEEHRRQFPQYAFRPSHRRTRGGDAEKDKEKDGKRKVREHVVDDPTRCAKIAELLGEGKHGRILDAAMQEFDRQRRPSVVARFEPPITATAYRRASSAPAPDTEPPLAFLCSAPIVTQRRRSSSSSPSSRSREPEEAPEEVPMETQPGTLDNSTDPNSAVDSFISPWTQDPETEYFGFSGFSFSPVYPPPSPDFTCDPLWVCGTPNLPCGNTTPFLAGDFHFAGEPGQASAPELNIGAPITDDCARAMYPESPHSPYFDHAPFLEHPAPAAGYASYDCDALCMGSPTYVQDTTPHIANAQPHLAQIETDFANLMAQYSPEA